ncbi:hypothetical protein C8Q74DRAFT_258450 [Fomes fomentarius]|nr:hypothetical protein C8Q74DRAFT_258450 [Fomes fomentarius]
MMHSLIYVVHALNPSALAELYQGTEGKSQRRTHCPRSGAPDSPEMRFFLRTGVALDHPRHPTTSTETSGNPFSTPYNMHRLGPHPPRSSSVFT